MRLVIRAIDVGGLYGMGRWAHLLSAGFGEIGSGLYLSIAEAKRFPRAAPENLLKAVKPEQSGLRKLTLTCSYRRRHWGIYLSRSESHDADQKT